jgi:hypothetical protein
MVAPRSFAAIRSSQDYRLHRRGLVRRFFRTKPRVVEARALDTCALLAVRAEWSAKDDNVTSDELVKIISAHGRALATLEMLAAERKPHQRVDNFGILREVRA